MTGKGVLGFLLAVIPFVAVGMPVATVVLNAGFEVGQVDINLKVAVHQAPLVALDPEAKAGQPVGYFIFPGALRRLVPTEAATAPT